jgi:two-component system response regulator HydG
MSQYRLLIVHSEPSSLALLSSMLKSLGHLIEEAANDRVAVRLMERGGIDLVLAGIDPNDPEALEFVSCVRRKHRHVPVILLFQNPNPERTKGALRLGALAVLRYPVPATELRAAITQALGTIEPAAGTAPARQDSAPRVITSQASSPVPQCPTNGTSTPNSEPIARNLGIVGSDPSLRQVIEMAATIASTRTPVLILGERGTGKTLLARTIHDLGARADQPFVTVDCAALTEAERERNSPAPANADGKNGIHAHPFSPAFDWTTKLSQAHGGTLFLNDVAALSDSLQLQVLRALQEREAPYSNGFGGHHDVRFLMSASKNLLGLVEQGKFRQDLYHRASVLCLRLPSLRHRGSDVEQLAEFFRDRFSLESGKNVVGFTRDALEALLKHEWPGNVRELEGVIQLGVELCQGTRITSGHLSPSLCHPRSSRTTSMSAKPRTPANVRPLREALEEPEKRIIIHALQALNWNRQETARVLDVNRTTLYKKMKKYGLFVDEPVWVN